MAHHESGGAFNPRSVGSSPTGPTVLACASEHHRRRGLAVFARGLPDWERAYPSSVLLPRHVYGHLRIEADQLTHLLRGHPAAGLADLLTWPHRGQQPLVLVDGLLPGCPAGG